MPTGWWVVNVDRLPAVPHDCADQLRLLRPEGRFIVRRTELCVPVLLFFALLPGREEGILTLNLHLELVNPRAYLRELIPHSVERRERERERVKLQSPGAKGLPN